MKWNETKNVKDLIILAPSASRFSTITKPEMKSERQRKTSDYCVWHLEIGLLTSCLSPHEIKSNRGSFFNFNQNRWKKKFRPFHQLTLSVIFFFLVRNLGNFSPQMTQWKSWVNCSAKLAVDSWFSSENGALCWIILNNFVEVTCDLVDF